jgi:hypothetical protein
MVSVSQVQRGFVNFIDNEIAVAFDGWQKAVMAGAAALLAAGMPNLIKTYGSNPVVAALNIYDANADAVNIDAIYNAFVPKLGAEKIPVVIPKIGTIKLGREEIDSLMRYIKEG